MNVTEAILTILKNENQVAVNEITATYPAFALAVARNDMAALASMLPDKLTMDKLATVATSPATGGSDNDDVSEEKPKATRSRRKPASADNEQEDKKARTSRKPAAKKEEEPASEYAGKSPKQLFIMCKDMGLTVKPHQDASVYIEAMEAAKAANDEAEDDDGWGEPDEAPASAKKTAAKGKAAPKKAEEDDDDDWDI